MRPPIRFVLDFSGGGVRERERAADDELRALPIHEHREHARLSAVLAAATVFSEPARAADATRNARRAADAAGDAIAHAWAAIAECVSELSCESTPERARKTADVLAIAQRTGETEFVDTAYLLHLSALAELGRMSELDQALSPVGTYLTSFPWLANGRHVAWFRCLQATLAGQATEAERLAHHAYAIAAAEDDPDAQSVLLGQLGILRWMQGRVVELEPAFLRARQTAPHEPIWGICLAWIWLRQGRTSAARALVASLPEISELPVDRNWLSSACILADVASELGDTRTARDVHAALVPFAERLVTIGLGVTCWGTVARPLALTAAAQGDLNDAIAYYRIAIDVAARAEAHPWLAEAQWELARQLVRRAKDGDLDEARALAAEAAATGRALHLHGIERPASALLESLPRDSGPDAQATAGRVSSATTPKPRIQVLNGFSVVANDGTAPRWQSRKARQLLKILVARRGAAVSRETVMDHLWPDHAPDALANRFSVAMSSVRRALDPGGLAPRDTYLIYTDGLIRLNPDVVDIDVVAYLRATETALASNAPPSVRRAQLADALALYTGEPLHEEREEVWSDDLRRDAHLAFFSSAHALAELLTDPDDLPERIDTYRRILALDPYDQRAHEGLIDSLTAAGSHGLAERARAEAGERMRELGVAGSTDAREAG